MADKGFEKTEGNRGGSGPAGEGQVQHDRAPIDEEHHGWAPDAGEPSEAIAEAGRKSFEKHTQNESEKRRETTGQ